LCLLASTNWATLVECLMISDTHCKLKKCTRCISDLRSIWVFFFCASVFFYDLKGCKQKAWSLEFVKKSRSEMRSLFV